MKKTIFLITLFALPYLVSAQNTFNAEIEYIRTTGKVPSEYILSKFEKHDLVLLGEDHGIKEHLDFVKELIPELYAAGVTNLCMEFGSFEMQSKLDSLVNAAEYNEQSARDMMFFYNVGWAYKEYTDIYKEVWKLNKSIPAGKNKFRIVNISYQYDWSKYTSPRTPESMSKVFYLGTPDEFRMRIIEKEILNKEEKAVVYMGLVHVFTRYGMPLLKINNDDFCDYDANFTGNRLYRKYSDKVTNIMFHHPFQAKDNAGSFNASPANGAIEVIMDKNGNRPVGFDLAGSPMGELPDNSYFSLCYADFRMKDFFDGYIFIKPFKSLTDCTVDSLYFEGKTWKEIKVQMPDPDWHTAENIEDYWRQIRSFVNIRNRYSELIGKSIPAVQSGSIDRYLSFPSRYVQVRNIDVWLPDNYSQAKKYPVLYMHDGLGLFDKSITWNHQEWDVDSVIGSLIKDKKVKDCIVVAIPNSGKHRASEYYPQKPFESLPAGTQERLLGNMLQGKIEADNYLRFLVEELKPFIDNQYSTRPDRANTFVMGSSMGGLISMYAICEYPEVFGGAACLSTHWIGDSTDPNNSIIPDSFVEYLKKHLPSPGNHKIYFDYGTEMLDSYYKPHQLKVDEVMRLKKYTPRQWVTKEFTGKDHSENSWNERLHVPLQFLLPR